MSVGQDHRHTLAPSGQGTVVLSLGAGIGALVIHTPAALHGHEIEVSPLAEPGRRTHAAVRARYVRGGVTYCVVIDNLAQGRYVIWRDPVTPLAEVQIDGGAVTEHEWPVHPVG